MKKSASRSERKAEKQRLKEEEKKKNFKLGLLLMGLALLLCLGMLIIGSKEDKTKPEESSAQETTEETTVVASNNTDDEEATSDESVVEIGNDINTVGNRVSFGEYEGRKIDWWVCETKDGNSLLVSTKSVATKPFHDTVQAEDANWERSTLREYLNSTFVDEAFSDDGKQCITDTEVTIYGEKTNDKIFILSEEQYTNYSKINNVKFDDNCWLTDTAGGLSRLEESDIGRDGEIDYGLRVNEECGVRPAVWVDAEMFKQHN